MLSYPRLSTAGYPFSEQGYVGLPDPAAATAALYANLVGAGGGEKDGKTCGLGGFGK